MASSPVLSYSISQRAVHWLTVLLVLFNFISGGVFDSLKEIRAAGGTPTPDMFLPAQLHAFSGIAILVLLVTRLCLRYFQGAPGVPADEPPFFQLVAKLVHGGLYLLLILMPVSGMAKMYGGVDLAGFIHAGPFKLAILVLIAVHVAGALVHQFYWKTNVLKRMTRG